MTSDIRANAPLVPEGASLDSPPAGPFPDIPEEKTEGCELTLPSNHNQNESDFSPFLRMASLLKRSDMKSPPLVAAPTAEKTNKQDVA